VRQTQRLHVADGGTLEWLPQETILYDGARARLGTRIELARSARFIGFDMVCFGLPARRAPFLHGDCRQTLEILRDGRPLLVERGHFDAQSSVWAARWGLAARASWLSSLRSRRLPPTWSTPYGLEPPTLPTMTWVPSPSSVMAT
jgi:urease accessory protein